MRLSEHISSKLDKLILEADSIAPSMNTISHAGNYGEMTDEGFDHHAFLLWNTRCLNLLARLQDGDTVHREKFIAEENRGLGPDGKGRGYHSTSIEVFRKKAVLEALKADVQEGCLFEHDLLVTADTLKDILEQAEHLLDKGYKDAAAVLVGAILESTLRKLCDKYGIAYTQKDTIHPLNDKLKDVAYNRLTHKQVIAWAELRNRAAHGNFGEYKTTEVRAMLDWVRQFSGNYLV